MNNLIDVEVHPLIDSKFLHPRRVHYKQNGVKKQWECVTEHNDVSILLFNTSRNVFIFVKQFRPAIYFNQAKATVVDDKEIIDTQKYPAELGMTLELCAGIVDKDLPLVHIAQEEVLEECGYRVPEDKIRKITSYRNGSGFNGAVNHLFYAEVTDAMQVTEGGGLASEGELIEVVEMSIAQAKGLVFDEQANREPGLMLAVMWFLRHVWPHSPVG